MDRYKFGKKYRYANKFYYNMTDCSDTNDAPKIVKEDDKEVKNADKETEDDSKRT